MSFILCSSQQIWEVYIKLKIMKACIMTSLEHNKKKFIDKELGRGLDFRLPWLDDSFSNGKTRKFSVTLIAHMWLWWFFAVICQLDWHCYSCVLIAFFFPSLFFFVYLGSLNPIKQVGPTPQAVSPTNWNPQHKKPNPRLQHSKTPNNNKWAKNEKKVQTITLGKI